jgi:hypothetical protein
MKYENPEWKRREDLRKSAEAARKSADAARHRANRAVPMPASSSTTLHDAAGPSHRVPTSQPVVSGQAPRTPANMGESNEASGASRQSQELLEAEVSQVSHVPQVLQDVQSIRDVQAPQDVQVLPATRPVQIRQDVETAQEHQDDTTTVQPKINAQVVQPSNIQVLSAQAQPFVPAHPAHPAQLVQPVQPVQPAQPAQRTQEEEDEDENTLLASDQTTQLIHGLSAIQIQAVPPALIYDSQRNLLPRIPRRLPLTLHHGEDAKAQFDETRPIKYLVRTPGHLWHCHCLACLFPKMLKSPCEPHDFEERIDSLGCLCPGRAGRLGIQTMVPCSKHDWGNRWNALARGGPWKDGRQRFPARIPEICQRPIDPVVFRAWIESLPCVCEEWKTLWNLEADVFGFAIQDEFWLRDGVQHTEWLQQCLGVGHRYRVQDDYIEAVREMLVSNFKLELPEAVQKAWNNWRQLPGIYSRHALMEPAPAILQNDIRFQEHFADICGKHIAPSLWLQCLQCHCVLWRTQWKRLVKMLWDAHPVIPALQILPRSHLAHANLRRERQTRKESLQELRATNLAIENTRRRRHGITIIPPFNNSEFGNHQGRFTNIYPYMDHRFGNTEEDPIIENRLNFLGYKSIWRRSVKSDGRGPYIQQPYDREGSIIWPDTRDLLWYGPMWHDGEGGIFGRVLPPVMQRFPPYRAPVPRDGWGRYDWKVRARFKRDPNDSITVLRNYDENEPVYEQYDGLWNESRAGREIRPTGDGRQVIQPHSGRPVMQTRDGKKPDEKPKVFEDPGLNMLPFDALWSEPCYGPRNGLRDPPFDNQADRDRFREVEERGMRYEERKYLLPALIAGLDEPDVMEMDDGGVAAQEELEAWKRVSDGFPRRWTSRFFLMTGPGEWAFAGNSG